MKHMIGIAAAALMGAALALTEAKAQQPTLYERLGGYDAVAELVDELIDRVRDDKFAGYSDASMRVIRQNIVDFICEGTGGPCFYRGRDIKTAHVGLGVTQSDWDNFVNVFGATMNDLQIPADVQKDFAGMMLPMEDQIVERR